MSVQGFVVVVTLCEAEQYYFTNTDHGTRQRALILLFGLHTHSGSCRRTDGIDTIEQLRTRYLLMYSSGVCRRSVHCLKSSPLRRRGCWSNSRNGWLTRAVTRILLGPNSMSTREKMSLVWAQRPRTCGARHARPSSLRVVRPSFWTARHHVCQVRLGSERTKST